MDEKERLLLEKAKSGDLKAFEELIEAHQKRIFNYILRMINNYDDALELTQEVFIKAFKALKSFKEEAQFSTWVYRIATNTCLDEIRKIKNIKQVSLDESIESNQGRINEHLTSRNMLPEDITEKNELIRALKNIIQDLPESMRAVVVLRDIQGFSYDEISNMLECPQGTIKSRINRARQTLKEIILGKRELIDNKYVNINKKGGMEDEV